MCLRHSYGPQRKGTFDNKYVGEVEVEPQDILISPAEASKRRVAAYEAAAAAAATAAAQSEEAVEVEMEVALDNKVDKQLAAIKADIDEGSNKDIEDIEGDL